MLFCVSACSTQESDGAVTSSSALILRYKDNEGVFREFDKCEEYDAADDRMNFIIADGCERLDLFDKFVSDADTYWTLYADAMGKTEIPTKVISEFDNGDNYYYITVTTSDKKYSRTFTLHYYKEYTVKVSFIDCDGNKIAGGNDAETAKFRDFLKQDAAVRWDSEGTIYLPGGTVLAEVPGHPKRNGYDFGGWYDLNGVQAKGRTLTEDAEFFPAFTAKTFTVTLDASGGTLPSGTSDKQAVVYDEAYSMSVPQKTGYVFTGWYYSDQDNKMTTATGESVGVYKINGDAVFYAVWEADVYSITFVSENPAWGTVVVKEGENTVSVEPYAKSDVGPAQLEFHYLAEIAFDVTPAKGYSFVKMLSAGVEIAPDRLVMPAKNVVIEVRFERFEVTFVSCDAAKGSEAGAGAYSAGSSVTVRATANTGYEFAAWYDGATVVSQDAEYTFTMPLHSVELSPQWSAVRIDATLDYDNGSVSETRSLTYNEEYKLPVPQKTGYEFIGWYEGATAVTDKTGNSFEASLYIRPVTLVAKWEAVSVSIILNANGGTCEFERINTSYASIVNLPVPALRGYDFAGWSIPNEQNTVTGAYSVTITKDTAFTANWTPKTVQIDLYLDGDMTDKYATVPATFAASVSLGVPSKTGYVFRGWSDNGSLVTASDGVLTSDYVSDVRLSAQWRARNYIVKFVTGTSERLPDSSVTYDSAYFFAPPAPRTGYDFAGWENEDRVLLTGADGNSVSPSKILSDITLTARWTAKRVVIGLDVNGGNALTQNRLELSYGDKFTLVAPTRTGHSFNNWQSAASGKSYNGGTQYSVDFENDMTLIAQWTANTYRVTYNVGSDVQMPAKTQQVTYGQPVQLLGATRAGYVLVKWVDADNNAIGDENRRIAEWQYTDDLTLNPVWGQATMYVSFDADGGNDVSQCPVVYGENFSVPVPEKEGYDFIGWYYVDRQVTDENGSSLDVYDFASSVTLKAQWQAKAVIILLDSDGGTISKDRIETQYMSTLVSLGVPAKTRYKFTGWYEGASQKTTANGVLSVVDALEYSLKAKYDPVMYTLTVTADSATQGTVTGSGTYAYGTTVTVTATPKSGYMFDGWYDVSNNKLSAELSYEVLIGGNVRLTARFAENDYETITTFDALKNMKANGKYMLGADIDCRNSLLMFAYEFNGELNGNGHKVSNMKVKNSRVSGYGGTGHEFAYVGMFASIGASGIVENVVFDAVTLELMTASQALPGATLSAGVIAGLNAGTISNCHVSGKVTCTPAEGGYSQPYFMNYVVGGIAGTNSGKISFCSSKSTLTVSDYCMPYNDVTVKQGMFIGGIAGVNAPENSAEQSVIAGCLSSGEVSVTCLSPSSRVYVGQLGGYNKSVIRDCKASGSMNIVNDVENTTGSSLPWIFAGGAVGIAGCEGGTTFDSVLERIYSDVEITVEGRGQIILGGIANAEKRTGTVNFRDCVVSGSITAESHSTGTFAQLKAGAVFGMSDGNTAGCLYLSTMAFNLTKAGADVDPISNDGCTAISAVNKSTFTVQLGFKVYSGTSVPADESAVWKFVGNTPSLFFE